MDYPNLILEQFFSGKVYAWGLFEARFGSLRREFQVEIDGQWEQNQLRLNERFRYADGECDTRVWTIRRRGDGHYVGQAADIVGEAVGHCRANRLQWRYRMRLQTKRGPLQLDFDDHFYLQPGGVMLNRARLRKWGVHLGDVTLFFCPAQRLQAPPFAL